MTQTTKFLNLCAGLLLLGSLTASAGGPVPFTLDLVLEAPSNLQVFFLDDLNVSGRAPSAQVFHATITPTNPSDTSTVQCYFSFRMLNGQGVEIMQGKSNPFPLPANSGLTVTNLNLTTDGSPYELEDYGSSSLAQEIEDKLVQTGYFPSDTYKLRLELYASNNELIAADEATAIITNPFTLQLISPAGSPAMPTILSSTTPVFSWASAATQFLLKVCERTSSDQDVESVLQNRPTYETDRGQPLAGQSFAYPTSNVIPLEPGHTYYWQVRSLVQTSGGEQEYPSSIGAFSILQNIDPQTQRIMTAIQRILGFSNMTVMNQLVGFQPSGDLRLDGLGITIEELEEMAAKFEQGAYQTTSVRAE